MESIFKNWFSRELIRKLLIFIAGLILIILTAYTIFYIYWAVKEPSLAFAWTMLELVFRGLTTVGFALFFLIVADTISPIWGDTDD